MKKFSPEGRFFEQMLEFLEAVEPIFKEMSV